MVDPFFETWKAQWSNESWSPMWSNTQQTIDNLMSQQQEIQNKYKELKSLLADETLTDTQRNEIHEQMQKLSDLYSYNKSTLAALSTDISGEKEIHVNKNIDTDKSLSKNFSFRKFMIWCGILLFLFLGWLVAVFYSLIKNPNRLQGFGIDGCTAVNLLQIFSIVFFGLLFFTFLSLFLINLNKIIVSKNKRKFPYALWSSLSFIVMIAVAFVLVMMLKNLSVEAENCKEWGNTQMVYSQVFVKDQKFKDVLLPESDYSKIIAPINIWFSLNKTMYNNEVLWLWSIRNVSVTFACWNWQELSLLANSYDFEWTCFYSEKWRYQPEVIINYIDAVWNQKSKVYDNPSFVKPIDIASEIVVQSEQRKIEVLNSAFLVWKNPVNMRFDAQSVFRDFNLYNYDEIKWSFECTAWNANSRAQVENEYREAWAHYVCMSLPSLLSDYVYTFPLRVEQWDVPPEFGVSYIVSTSNNQSYNNPKSIEVSKLPIMLTLQVTSVNPETPTTQKKLYKDGEQVQSQFSDPNTFKVTIDEDKTYVLTLDVSDSDKQISSSFDITVSVKRDTILWSLSVMPWTVWTSPFEVKFDASTTTLNDASDEIVFFSWDFWDGKVIKDTSTSIISHTYEYDFDKENWVYYPSVELRTKNWLTYVISWTIINVKKPETTIEIFLDEHPAQLASVWEVVPMSISVDGMPTKIYWNFWDGETQECDWRSCAETFHIYEKESAYAISVKVDFEGSQSLEWKINLLVQ